MVGERERERVEVMVNQHVASTVIIGRAEFWLGESCSLPRYDSHGCWLLIAHIILVSIEPSAG